MLFCRFLHESRGGRTIWQCDGADLRAYKAVRLRGDGPCRVSVSTWRRSVAALDKWVRWAQYEGLIVGEPFRYVDKTVMTPNGLKRIRVNAEQEPGGQGRPMRFLPFEDYLLWRNVGLRGELPDGSPDPSWRGRHGERNAVFADLLVYTGMRLGEAASLLVTELPPLSGVRVLGDVHLSAAVTKRGKARTVFVNRRTLRDLHQYRDIERDGLVARRRAAGSYGLVPDTLLVRGAGRHALTLLDGRGSWSYSKLDPATRSRLMQAVDGRAVEPLALWLGDDGLPLARSTWQSAFRRANRRCAGFDLPLEVHHAIMTAFERLMQGRPELSDGAVTVTNICTEAGISRASYYRSPTAPVIRTLLTAPDTTRPELDELREEVKRLRHAERALRREHATQLRELKDTNATYANHIQLLTLANTQLRGENHQLRQQAARHTNLRVLPPAGG